MKFYAYIPREDGTEPLGTIDRLIFDSSTVNRAIRKCRRIYGDDNFILRSYLNFYDETTFVTHFKKGEKL